MWQEVRPKVEKWAACNAYTLIFMTFLAVIELVVIILVGVFL